MFFLPGTCKRLFPLHVKVASKLSRGYNQAAVTSAACGLREVHERLLAKGSLLPDRSQQEAVAALQLLQEYVVGLVGNTLKARSSQLTAHQQDSPDAANKQGQVSIVENGVSDLNHVQSESSNNNRVAVQGVADVTLQSQPVALGAYLYGPVGSGKTRIMDMFCTTTSQLLRDMVPTLTNSEHWQHPVGGGADGAVGQHHGLKGTENHRAGTTRDATQSASAIGASISQIEHNAPSSGNAAPAGPTETETAAPQEVSVPAVTALPAVVPGVKRLHFHALMLHVHQRMHDIRRALPKVVVPSQQGLPVYRYAEPEEHPIETVAKELCQDTAVLALDELHVVDVADAMILARLFTVILDQGTCVLFTSNSRPSDLYKNGLSYDYFRPFVDLIEQNMLVLKISAGTDYRRHLHQERAAGTSMSATAEAETQSSTASTKHRATLANVAASRPHTIDDVAHQVRKEDSLVALLLMHPSTTDFTTSTPAPRKRDNSFQSHTNMGLYIYGHNARQLQERVWQRLLAHSVAGEQERRVRGSFGRSLWVPCAADVVVVPVGMNQQQHAPPDVRHMPAVLSHENGHDNGGDIHGDGWGADTRTVAQFTFEQLCGEFGLRKAVDQGGPLAASDMLSLCQAFDVIFITDVPQFTLPRRDEARRLVTFIDVAYDLSRCRVVLSSDVHSEELFTPLFEAAKQQGINPLSGTAQKRKKGNHKTAGDQDVNKHAASSTTGASSTQSTSGSTARKLSGGDEHAAGIAAYQPDVAQDYKDHMKSAVGVTWEPPLSSGNATHPMATGYSRHADVSGGYSTQEEPEGVAMSVEEVLMYHRARSRLLEMVLHIPV